MLTTEQQEQILAELRWYGHEIAGGGPMVGWAIVARRANKRWYDTTLPLLMELNAVHGPIAHGDSCTTPVTTDEQRAKEAGQGEI